MELKMEELIRKLKEAGKGEEIFESEESFMAAIKELGYSVEGLKQVAEDQPLDEGQLEAVAGGMSLIDLIKAAFSRFHF